MVKVQFLPTAIAVKLLFLRAATKPSIIGQDQSPIASIAILSISFIFTSIWVNHVRHFQEPSHLLQVFNVIL